MKHLIVATLALSLSGCFFVSKKNNTSSNSRPVTSEPGHKNHGQQRKEEVHQRNAERKAAKDAEKGKK